MHTILSRKAAGQGLPIIALMIVVLFGMVALAVDVGNTYAEQRTVVRASNAASLAAIDAVIKGYDDPGVAAIIDESLKANGLRLLGPKTPTGNRQVLARYMDINGKPIWSCLIGSCPKVPPDVNYVEVKVDGLVDTYFARVVGQSTLPVHATSFAGRCSPTNGVYPLAVQSGDLDLSSFKKPTDLTPTELAQVYGTKYPYPNYPAGLTWRRLQVKNTSPLPGTFSFLRWDSASGSPSATAAAFKGDGTLKNGTFKEVDWPNNGTPKPANYPLAPGQPTINDWIGGDTTLTWGNAADDPLRTNLQALMTKHTLLLLPIVDDFSGGASSSQFKLARMGSFYLIDPLKNGGIVKQGGNSYIYLAYVGNANESPCLVTNVDPDTTCTGTCAPTTDTVDLIFPFKVNPAWAGTDKPNLPIAFEMVVDVSGSMSWDFNGHGALDAIQNKTTDSTGGTNKQCEYSKTASLDFPKSDDCYGGPNSSWRVIQDRRIYRTKEALKSFINAMGPFDSMRLTSFSTSGIETVPTTGWTSVKDDLLKELPKLGANPSDYPYRTSGGTPGADAMAKAKDIILAAPATALNGQAYRRVVVYLTDGVANQFLSPGGQNTARDNCPTISVIAALNSPECQTGTMKSGQLRPINAMVAQAKLLKEADPSLQLYVVALAGVATTGLAQVASLPSMMYPVKDANLVTAALDNIREDAEVSTCLGQGGTTPLDTIAPQNHAELGAPYTLAPNVYGQATIYDKGGKFIKTVDITLDGANKLSARFDLPPENYQLEAWIGYKGPDDPKPVSRVYKALSLDEFNPVSRIAITVRANQSLNTTQVALMTYVDLDRSIDVCSGR